jgi:flagellar biosynthesis protein FlhF
MAECLVQVKTAMGAEAIILHTRTYQTREWLGLRRREVVEITAGKGMKVGSRPRPGAAATRNDRPRPDDGDQLKAAGPIPGTYGRSGAARRPEAAAGTARRPHDPKALLETPAAANAVMLNLTNEVTTLKQMMTDLLRVTRHKHAPQVSEELMPVYELLVGNRVDEEVAGDLVRSLGRQVRAEYHANLDYMKERLVEQLERQLPVRGPIASADKGGPTVVALVGPTGVGKTTTIAKLAADLKLRKKQRVGLITLDTYRIAAVDQLKRYAEIIGAPLKVVGSAEELRHAVEALDDMEYVLIDTAGRSPNDKLKLNELKTVLEAATPDEVHLVLSTTASEECLELAMNQFGDVRVDGVVLTKLDEAAKLGVLVNIARRLNRNVSYVTTGQDVPDDIEIAEPRRLARLVLGETI